MLRGTRPASAMPYICQVCSRRAFQPQMVSTAQGWAANTVRTFLSLTKLKAVTIPLPALSLQQQFADIVRKYERVRAQQRETERQAEHLFQSLLHRAFQEAL